MVEWEGKLRDPRPSLDAANFSIQVGRVQGVQLHLSEEPEAFSAASFHLEGEIHLRVPCIRQNLFKDIIYSLADIGPTISSGFNVNPHILKTKVHIGHFRPQS